MEMFSECKNRYFHLVFQILNLAKEGLSKEEVIKLIDQGEYDEKLIGKDFKTFQGFLLNEYDENENFNLLSEKDGAFYPIINTETKNPLPVRFTIIEKMWIRRLIEEPMAKVLLGESLVEKLQMALKDVKNAPSIDTIEMTNKARNGIKIDFTKFERDFHTILKAIVEEKAVRYSNVDKWGNQLENKVSLPIRIEYSLKDDKFRVSMYSLDESRAIMVNLHTIHHVKIADDIKQKIDRKTVLKALKEKRYSKEPIVVELKDERGAMERCFMSFSGYERSSRSLGHNKYEIKLYYYTFEEDEVVRKIIALGPYVRVISPQRIIGMVVNQIRKAMELSRET